MDQGLAHYEPDGRVSFRYGGDFNDYDATDNSFNCNGIIAPDRTWHPHAYEVKRQYQNIWTELLDPGRRAAWRCTTRTSSWGWTITN